MKHFNKRAAAQLLARLNIQDVSRELVEHWLSLWQGDALPPRAAFNPSRFKAYLPSIILFNVVPDVSVHVRLAGTRYQHFLGTELTGRDWIAAAPDSYKPVRLKAFSDVARGAVVLDHRLLAMDLGANVVAEEIVLPFAPDPDGVSQVMAHVNVTMDQFLKIASVQQALGDPIDLTMILLPAADAELAELPR